MIQRIQSLYLFIGAICIAIMAFVPFSKIIIDNQAYYLFLDTIKGSSENIAGYQNLYILALGILTGLGFFISIFLYKNRIRQMRFNAIVFIFNCLLIVLMFWYPDHFAKSIGGNAYFKEIGILMPLISLVMLVLANKAIKKDEIKVRAADRLR